MGVRMYACMYVTMCVCQYKTWGTCICLAVRGGENFEAGGSRRTQMELDVSGAQRPNELGSMQMCRSCGPTLHIAHLYKRQRPAMHSEPHMRKTRAHARRRRGRQDIFTITIYPCCMYVCGVYVLCFVVRMVFS